MWTPGCSLNVPELRSHGEHNQECHNYKARDSYEKLTKESFILPLSEDFKAPAYPVFGSTLLDKSASTGVSPEKNSENHKQLKKCPVKKHLLT